MKHITEKYYGIKKHEILQNKLRKSVSKIQFTEDEKDIITAQMIEYINEKDFVLYHDFMDDIAETHSDWFNLIAFDKGLRQLILEYIKSKVRLKRKK